MKSTNNQLHKLSVVSTDDTEESEMLKASKYNWAPHYHPRQIFETFKTLFPMYSNLVSEWAKYGHDSIKIVINLRGGDNMVLYFELYYKGGWRLYSVDDTSPAVSRSMARELDKRDENKKLTFEDFKQY